MSKVKSSKADKSSDPLAKVKSAGVTKPTKSEKSKSKDVAKAVSKKDIKKMKKAPTPEPESSESEASSVSSASESDESESEVEAKPVKNGKANGVKAVSKADLKKDSSDESGSDASSGSESEADVKGSNGVPTSETLKAATSDESDSDASEGESADDSDASDDSATDAKSAPKSAVMGKKLAATNGAAKKATAGSDDSADDSDDESSEGDSSDDSEDSEAEEEAKPKSSKRKAEDEEPARAKKIKKEETEAATNSPNLFCGGLSWNIDDEWLKQEFEVFGELVGARVMTDRDSGRSKGFGYVEFVNAADAAKAYEAKFDTELDGRKINLDWAKPRQEKGPQDRAKQFADKISEPSDTLFVGNISFDAGQDAISTLFEGYGTILGVRLPTDRETGEPKGFGYVTFSSVDEAQAALEGGQGAYLEGRPLRLDYSKPRDPNGDAGGRGGFGGRGGGRGRGGFNDRGRGRGGFGDRGRGGRGGGRGGFGARGGKPNTTNRGGFGDFKGSKVSFD